MYEPEPKRLRLSQPTRNQYEDISIVYHGSQTCTSFINEFKEHLCLQMKTECFTWSTGDLKYDISNNGTKVVKTAATEWGKSINAVHPITGPTYFQLKIIYLSDNTISQANGGGLIVGISETQNSRMESRHSESVICIFNTHSGNDNNSVNVLKSCLAIADDVIGVVVDLKNDRVLFYINGKLVGYSTQKPSKMRQIFASVWIFYKNCELQAGDFIKYKDLEPFNH
jgi:hypothetical protein